ncbi:septal ring lytic transglycosylase RlpA family protein [Stenotrophomonas sp. Marseille-Q4652]|uniref:septal ring lytic transglycosylase RlpA family protein n=1 Tax=Stenotrophomonas sp. Marseille-Q4652 TaxID=2866595 RepID=UPI001CE4895C|nr:septal ring lytic transglycosylase RlpA family protein [Stenotrophomonas sp. Marseille-Q4652]
MRTSRWLVAALVMLGLAACSSAPRKSGPAATAGSAASGGPRASAAADCPDGSPYAPAKEDPSTRGNYTAGGLYKPGVKDSTPSYVPNVACIPEPVVREEPRSPVGNRSPYLVLGKEYKVLDRVEGYSEKGIASYYGSKFHGRLTSNREVYDMYAFSAAHKTLPLPSFARVTNLDTGESVIVRVNDRGPFHDGRVIDLSYAAAVKLGITQRGTGRVEVTALTPESENKRLLASRSGRGSTPAKAAPASSTTTATPTRAASDMDQLVQRLPATAPVVAAVQGADNAAEKWRYRVAESATPGSADNFDAWMKQQGVRVATGRPATTSAATAATPAAVAVAALPATAAAVTEPSPAASAALGKVLLQVASFSSRDNATRALTQLSAAGIAGATLSDIVSGGRTLWRLRVAASDHDSAAELAGRIASLGLGRPQIVRD